MSKRDLSELKIPYDYISIFASGNSIDNLSAETIAEIKSKSFLITINYAPIKINGHMNIWSDKKVSDFLNKHYTENPKDCIFLSRERAFNKPGSLPIYNKVDYWFEEKSGKMKGNYTIVWLLQLIKKFFPDKKILIFGLDMKIDHPTNAKWYDGYTDWDKKGRPKNHKNDHKLKQCSTQIEKFVTKDNVYNCNLDSGFEFFEKKEWKSIIS